MYKTFHDYCLETFGCKVYKLSLDGGFTCPNRDGSLGTGGCIFCTGSGEFAAHGHIATQLQEAKAKVQHKNKSGKYMAYFQAFTNTYAPVEKLRQLYEAALAPEEVVGLSVGTRPDCLPPETVALLGSLNQKKPVMVELGLQTIHPATVAYIRRGYENEVYYEAVKNLRAAGIHVVTHVIIGLPGETPQMAVETTRAAVAAGTSGIKFHLLHVLRGTDLAKDYEAGKFRCLELQQYGEILKDCLGVLPPEIVVHRITGDGAKKDLIAPQWSADKKRVLNYLHSILQPPTIENNHLDDEKKCRKTVRLPGYDYNTPGAYFLTICTENRKCILSRIVGTGVLDGPNTALLPYGRVAEKYLLQLNDFYDNLSVESYVIMPNHIHILLQITGEGPSGRPVPTAANSVVSRFVSTFKRFCNKEYGKNIWQARSYDHIIRDQADFDKHLKYIYENPFAWQKDELYEAEPM